MATVSELVECFSNMTDVRPEEGSVRARHMREASLLPTGGRGRGGAQVSAAHCGNYLVGWLASERAINCAAAVRLFAELVPHSTLGDLNTLRSEARTLLLDKDAKQTGESFIMPNVNFVEAIARLIEWSRYLKTKEILWGDFKFIGCSRNWPFAFLQFQGNDGQIIRQDYHQLPLEGRSHRIKLGPWQLDQLNSPAPIRIEAMIPSEIIDSLGELLGERDSAPPRLSEIAIPYE